MTFCTAEVTLLTPLNFLAFFNHTEIILKLNSWERLSPIKSRKLVSTIINFFLSSFSDDLHVIIFLCVCPWQTETVKNTNISACGPSYDGHFPPYSFLLTCQRKGEQSLKSPKKPRKLKQWFFEYYISVFSKAMQVLQVSGLPCSFPTWVMCRSKAGSQPRRLCAADAVTMLKQ